MWLAGDMGLISLLAAHLIMMTMIMIMIMIMTMMIMMIMTHRQGADVAPHWRGLE